MFETFIMQVDKPMPISGRIYPKAAMAREIQQMQSIIQARALCGHLDHQSGVTIDFAQVSHMITDLRLCGNAVFAKIQVLDTPNGKILQTLLDNKVKVVFAIIGIGGGIVNDEGYLVINDDFKLITINAVAADGMSKLFNSNPYFICPECKGTGKYVGLNKIEPCRNCTK